MTQIISQGVEGSYHHEASLKLEKELGISMDSYLGLDSFEECWSQYAETNMMVIAIENSYAGSIYENLYRFLKYDVEIVAEINVAVNFCICSQEKNISDVSKVYAHFKALPQCYEYLKKHGIENQIVHPDNAGAAQMISETYEKGAAALCSEGAAQMYGLNVLDTNIQDQKGNTTRFLAIAPKKMKCKCPKISGKVSILFEARDIPASLYKCLGAFATNGVNLTKIESLPDIKNPFSYLFWLDFEGNLDEKRVKNSLQELEFFTSKIIILGEY